MSIFSKWSHNEPDTKSDIVRHNRWYPKPYSMATRPTFGQWLKVTWLDILTMALSGALGLGIYMLPPLPTRSFAVTYPHSGTLTADTLNGTGSGDIVNPAFAYPLRKEIIPIWLAALLASLIPILVILLAQIRIRSFWDANNGIIGLLYSLITAAVFQVFVKWCIGGLRPHFLDVCKPDFTRINRKVFGVRVSNNGLNGVGFEGLYWTREICTGNEKQINDSLESMPSGHTTAAFAGFVFLSLYLNGKLKVWSNYHPAMWKAVMVWMPILGACLIGGSLTIDEFHHWYDVTAGAVIGTVMAFSAYRMVYASVWDWRWNHVPLNRSRGIGYRGEDAELGDAMFTRSAGWGHSSARAFAGQEHGIVGGGHSHCGSSVIPGFSSPVHGSVGTGGDFDVARSRKATGSTGFNGARKSVGGGLFPAAKSNGAGRLPTGENVV